MEKNKNRVFKLLGLLVVVFLVCLCMLGSTFARYTTGVSGTATAKVAEWDVSTSGDLNASTTTTIGSLSPMLYDGSTDNGSYSTSVANDGYKLVNIIYKKVAVISITKIDVDAQIQLTYGGVTIHGTGNSNATLSASDYSSWSANGISSSSGLTEDATWDQVIGTTGSALQFNVGYVSSDSASSDSASFDTAAGSMTSGWGYEAPTGLTSLTNGTTTSVSISSGTSSTYYHVYAWVTWTSDYYSATDGDVVDAIDTWIGMNVASVSATVTCKLVQASTVTSQDSSSLN